MVKHSKCNLPLMNCFCKDFRGSELNLKLYKIVRVQLYLCLTLPCFAWQRSVPARCSHAT
eukprot:3442846-Rhodomonas_salina.1